MKLKVTILVDPGDEQWFLRETVALAQDYDPPIFLVGADVIIHEGEGRIDYIMSPEQLTDEVDYMLGHAAALLKGRRLDPEEVEGDERDDKL